MKQTKGLRDCVKGIGVEYVKRGRGEEEKRRRGEEERRRGGAISNYKEM